MTQASIIGTRRGITPREVVATAIAHLECLPGGRTGVAVVQPELVRPWAQQPWDVEGDHPVDVPDDLLTTLRAWPAGDAAVA